MTTPTIVPVGFNADASDFRTCKVDRSGAVRQSMDTVTVTTGTAANAYVGLVPFNKGARFIVNDKSVYCGNFGAGTTTANLGIIYDDDTTYTNDPDAFASASAAPQAGGFVTVDETTGLTLVTEGNGWLAVQVLAAAADADADISFSVGVVYDQPTN